MVSAKLLGCILAIFLSFGETLKAEVFCSSSLKTSPVSSLNRKAFETNSFESLRRSMPIDRSFESQVSYLMELSSYFVSQNEVEPLSKQQQRLVKSFLEKKEGIAEVNLVDLRKEIQSLLRSIRPGRWQWTRGLLPSSSYYESRVAEAIQVDLLTLSVWQLLEANGVSVNEKLSWGESYGFYGHNLAQIGLSVLSLVEYQVMLGFLVWKNPPLVSRTDILLNLEELEKKKGPSIRLSAFSEWLGKWVRRSALIAFLASSWVQPYFSEAHWMSREDLQAWVIREEVRRAPDSIRSERWSRERLSYWSFRSKEELLEEYYRLNEGRSNSGNE